MVKMTKNKCDELINIVNEFKQTQSMIIEEGYNNYMCNMKEQLKSLALCKLELKKCKLILK